MATSFDIRLVVETLLVTAAMIAFGASAMYAVTRARRASPDMLLKMQAHIERQQVLLEREQARGTRAEARMDLMELEIEDLRESQMDSSNEIGELRTGLSKLVKQIEDARMTPVWTPDQVVKRTRTKRVDVTSRLSEAFSVEEIDGLAFEFGLAPDELDGETRGARARALTVWAADRGRLGELRKRIDELRPRYGRPNL